MSDGDMRDTQQLLHLVEAAQREGLSEDEIGDLVADAVDADTDVTRAA
jgi:hypothetical protein